MLCINRTPDALMDIDNLFVCAFTVKGPNENKLMTLFRMALANNNIDYMIEEDKIITYEVFDKPVLDEIQAYSKKYPADAFFFSWCNDDISEHGNVRIINGEIIRKIKAALKKRIRTSPLSDNA